MRRRGSLLGLFRPTGSWLERLPVGWTYALVLALTVPALLVRRWELTAASLAVTAALLLSARLGLRGVRVPWPLLLLLVVMGGYQAATGDAVAGLVLAGNVMLAVWASRLLTMTTPVPVLMDAVAARPLRLLGVSPERVALAVTVMLSSIPYLSAAFVEVGDAARARGLQRRARAWVTPVVVRAVGHAQATGDALTARGLGDDPA